MIQSIAYSSAGWICVEVYRVIPSDQIWPNATKLAGHCWYWKWIMTKNIVLSIQEFFKTKVIFHWQNQWPNINPTEHGFHLLKTERPTAAKERPDKASQGRIQKLVMSMSFQLLAVFKMYGPDCMDVYM